MSTSETALHEAGHAVAHVRLGISQEAASIEPVPERGLLGSVHAEGFGHVWDADGARNQVLAYCAGYAALIAAGLDEAQAVAGADGDFDYAIELIEFWGLDGTIETWKHRAVSMMHEPRNVRAVTLVAEYLERERRLDAELIDVLVEYADGEATTEEFEKFVYAWSKWKSQQ